MVVAIVFFYKEEGSFHKPFLAYFDAVRLSLPRVCKWYHFGGLKEIEVFTRPNPAILVFHASIGQDLRDGSGDKLIISEFAMSPQQPVCWETATAFPWATTSLAFALRGVSGLGVLTYYNKDGTDLCIISTGTLGGTNNEVRSKP